MAEPITSDALKTAVAVAVAATPSGFPGDVANRVIADPAIAPALKPVSRLASETLQGITAAGVAQLLNLTGAVKSLVIVAGWFGRSWDADQVATVLTTALTVAGLAWAWYGRETTSRPLK